MMIEEGGTIFEVNDPARIAFGLTRKKIRTTRISDLLKGYDYQQSYQNEEFQVLEGGVEKFFSISQSLRSTPGPVRAKILILRDITQRKKGQREREKLEHQVAQKSKMEAIGKLAGGIAHDFNNNLNPILGYARLIQEKTADQPALRRYADHIVSASENTAETVKNLLSFARMGKYLSVPVNMHVVIRDVIALLSHSMEKNVAVEERLHALHPNVVGDPAQLRNAILNVVVNAQDSMPDGGNLNF